MAENKTLEHLPEVRAAVAVLSPEDRKLLAAVQASPFKLTAPEQFKEFAANIDYFVFEPNIHDLNDLGWRYLAQHMDMLLPPELLKAIDPVPFGKYAMQEEQGHFTEHGYISLSGDEWNHERPAEPEKKPSIRERLEQGKKECAEKNKAQPHKAALDAPEKSHADEMLAFAEKAEREYAAEIAAYVQTPADIAEQAQAVPRDTFSIYQLKPGDATRDYRFEPLDAIRNNGLSVKPENYELVYTAPLTAKDDLESIYTRFNVDRPADFTGHSLSVSDIVVLHQDGKNTAHYCDRVGFSEVPEFLQERQPELTPDDLETGECIRTPRGSFYVTAMSREQMEAAGYGVHHISDDGKYLIMGNGTRAFAVAAEQPEKDNPLRTAEMTLEDDYGMIDGVINNGRRGEELEKAQEYAERTTPEKSSIRERLEDAKRECAEHKPQEVKKPGRDVPEHDCL